jgi:hypothetical protein
VRRSPYWSLAYTILAATVCSAVILAPSWERDAQAAPAPPAAISGAVLAQTPPPAPYPPPPPSAYPPPPPGSNQGPPPPPPPGGYPYAGSSEMATATAQGTQDAEADLNGAIWFLAGCGLTWIGIIIAYVVDPVPPASRMMGKSPEYVVAYTAAYKAAGKSAQAHQAIIGCVVNVAVSLALLAVFFFVFLQEASATNSGGV